jgi:hypothetical protein
LTEHANSLVFEAALSLSTLNQYSYIVSESDTLWETRRFRSDVPTSLLPPATTSSATEKILHLYGISLNKVEAVVPPLNLWDKSKQSVLDRPEIDVLVAPPPAKPPSGLQYPHAPVYHLNTSRDNRWRRGFYYWTPYHPVNADEVFERTMATTTPPNIGPTRFENGQFQFDPVPDMIQMPDGIPFVNFIGGDNNKPVTVACLQTMRSLSHYAEAAEIQQLVEELQKWTWGCPASDRRCAIRPIFEMDGLKPNDRSAKTTTNDGSYNLASTILQGNGIGVAQPAVQTTTPEAIRSTFNINNILARLYRLVLPTCISKEELDVTDFHAIDNNIFCLGGLDPNNTSIQLNVSSTRLGGVLAGAIGKESGWWHVDGGDDPSRWTLLTLLLRLPPGECYASP